MPYHPVLPSPSHSLPTTAFLFQSPNTPDGIVVDEILTAAQAGAARSPYASWTLRVSGTAPRRLSDGCVKRMGFVAYDDPRGGAAASTLLAALGLAVPGPAAGTGSAPHDGAGRSLPRT